MPKSRKFVNIRNSLSFKLPVFYRLTLAAMIAFHAVASVGVSKGPRPFTGVRMLKITRGAKTRVGLFFKLSGRMDAEIIGMGSGSGEIREGGKASGLRIVLMKELPLVDQGPSSSFLYVRKRTASSSKGPGHISREWMTKRAGKMNSAGDSDERDTKVRYFDSCPRQLGLRIHAPPRGKKKPWKAHADRWHAVPKIPRPQFRLPSCGNGRELGGGPP